MGAVVTLNSPPTGIIYPTAADAPYPERAERKLRRMRTVQDFGAIADDDPVTGLGTDNTEAFNRALASGKMVWVPGDDVDPERGLTFTRRRAGRTVGH